MPDPNPQPARDPLSSSRIFSRLLGMLRPYWGWIALGVIMLILSAPCELFPAITWQYITDDVVLHKDTRPWMTTWFSFNGRITGQFTLLAAATCWMFAIYLVGETLGTLEA